MRCKSIFAVAAVMALAIPTIAQASSGESSSLRFKAGTFSINPMTCKFLVAEADKPLGASWAEGRIYVAYEDGRHDSLMRCNRIRQDRVAACWKNVVPPVSEATPDKQGFRDERGLSAIQAYLVAVRACTLAAVGR